MTEQHTTTGLLSALLTANHPLDVEAISWESVLPELREQRLTGFIYSSWSAFDGRHRLAYGGWPTLRSLLWLPERVAGKLALQPGSERGPVSGQAR